MRLKSLFAALGAVLFAGSLAAQPQLLPTAKVPPPPRGVSAPLATPALEPENTLNLDLSTGGRVVIQLRPDLAPNHVERIRTLARRGFYNGHVFHRVIEGFMAQTGDPTGTGSGGSDLPDVAAEFNAQPHLRGTVAAARAQDENSANSQFYIMFAPRFTLDGKYTVFGRVVSGMQFVDAIEKGEPPENPSRIVRATIGNETSPVATAAPAPAPAAAPAAQAAAPAPAAAPTPAPEAQPKPQ
jgi:peptidylprolyl isomerase